MCGMFHRSPNCCAETAENSKKVALNSGFSLRAVLDGVAAVFMIAASALLIYVIVSPRPPVDARRPAPQPMAGQVPIEPQSLQGAVLKGSSNARVALIEYSESWLST